MNAQPIATPTPLLLTARLRLVAPEPRWAAPLADFYRRNRAHLAPWDPPREADFDTEPRQAQWLHDAAQRQAAGTQCSYLLQSIGDASRVVGTVNFTNIVRGGFHSCVLGYALDQQCEGQALMTEALRCAIGEVFSAHINLHRVQAAFQPENWRSAEVLKRLGFQEEGLARDYLFIDGMWRTHRLVALLNKGFTAPSAWRAAP
jgi:ribosomal-protein-alanine N-acetyltransferase